MVGATPYMKTKNQVSIIKRIGFNREGWTLTTVRIYIKMVLSVFQSCSKFNTENHFFCTFSVSSKTKAPVEEFVNSLYGKVETHTL